MQNRQKSRDELSVWFGDSNQTHLNYSILSVDDKFKTDQTYSNNFEDSNSGSDDHYIISGFLALQNAIDEAFAAPQYASFPLDFEIGKMPSNIRALFRYESIAVPMIIWWLVYVISVINSVLVPAVEEKESGIKEFLRIASSYSHLNMAMLAVTKLIIGMCIFGVVFAIFSSYGLAEHLCFGIMLVLVLLYLVSLIAYSFMVSVLFNTGMDIV